MNNFKQYKRKGLSEMISVKEFISNGGDMANVSTSLADKILPLDIYEQGFVARNPKNHEDLWYVAKKYFDDNLEEDESTTETFMDRLIAERDQLSDRLLKLEGFLSNETKATEISGPKQVGLLQAQSASMAIYLNILDKRIDDLAPQASN